MLLFANPLLQLIEAYPKPMLFFFIGTVAGGVPLMVKSAGVKKLSWRQPVYVLVGLLVVVLLSLIPTDMLKSDMQAGVMSTVFLVVAGFIAAVALVLPGISVSYLLLLMGLYDETVRAISELYFPFLIPLGIGLILGIVLTTKVLETAMEKHPQPTFLIILGFMLASIAEIFPGMPTGMELLYCPLTLLAGFGVVRLLSMQTLRAEKTE